MYQSILEKAIEATEKRVNFRCIKCPNNTCCEGCKEDKTCGKECLIWNCNHNLDFFMQALVELNTNNPQEYINFVKKHGGYCDCEVIFNTKMYLENKAKKTPSKK